LGLCGVPCFGDPRRHRLCLGLTKFSQRQLGAAAEERSGLIPSTWPWRVRIYFDI
jgi:hypothetical protein